MRHQFFQWIASVYAGRMIRISGEPYLTHLVAVAELAAYALPFGYEIGLSHDLLEDTGTTSLELSSVLSKTGYSGGDADFITSVVVELTDVYTKSAFPEFSKEIRKAKEEERLATVSGHAQSVKYADLIFNARWTVTNSPEKALDYLQRKLALVMKLDKGDQVLRGRTITTLEQLKQSMK